MGTGELKSHALAACQRILCEVIPQVGAAIPKENFSVRRAHRPNAHATQLLKFEFCYDNTTILGSWRYIGLFVVFCLQLDF